VFVCTLTLDGAASIFGVDEPHAPDSGHATRLMRAAASGDAREAEALFHLLHGELYRLAARQMHGERADHTLQATALLNEAWLKLRDGQADFRDRQHFLATAARAMRQVLVDHARARLRDKRGGGRERVELPEDVAAPEPEGVDLVALDRALEELRAESPRLVQVVECRYFADLDVEQTAAALGLSARTVARDWRFARAWLAEALGNGPVGSPDTAPE